jgi:hypothetical protein
MGLNWAQAGQNAAAGLDRMSQNKMQQADMLYKEVAEQNRMRFEEKIQQDQRDFLTKSDQAKWDRDQPYRTAELNLRGQEIEATTRLRESQQDATEAYQQASLAQGAQRIGLEGERVGLEGERVSQYAEQSQAKTMQDQSEFDRRMLKDLEDRRKSAAGTFDPASKRVQADWDFEFGKEMLSIKGKTPQEITEKRGLYEEAYKYLTSSFTVPSDEEKFTAVQENLSKAFTQSRKLASDYANMPEEARRRVQEEFNALGDKQSSAALKNIITKQAGNPLGSWSEDPAANADQAKATDANDTTDKVGKAERDHPMKPGKYDWQASSKMSKEDRRSYQAQQVKSVAAWKKAVEERAKQLAEEMGFDWRKDLSARDTLMAKAEEELTKSGSEEKLWADAPTKLAGGGK